MERSRLLRGDLLPRMIAPDGGRRSRSHHRRTAVVETAGLAPEALEPPMVWAEARGANVLDLEGNRYVDLTSGFGVAAIGHRHPAVVEAIRRQSGRLIHGLGDAQGHPLRLELAVRLAARVPISGARVAFAVSGADAVELAIKTALLATGRKRLIAFEPSYHGMTLGALAATSRPSFRRVVASHLHRHLSRLPFGGPLDGIDAALGRGDVAAVVVEPIVGREGVLVPPAGWLAGVADACRRHGTLLIADEILTGCGRTGRWFAVEHEEVATDLICCGKALAGGMPIAMVAGRSKVMAAWDEPGEARHTATFNAQPLACAAALASLRVLAGERLVARARTLGKRFAEQLDDWPERLPAVVVATRGRGALWGIEFSGAGAATTFAQEARRRGVLVLAGGPRGRVVELAPPLVITDPQLRDALDRLEEAARAATDE